jgi:hypothetical protein
VKTGLNLELLKKTREAVNADPAFRQLGTCDARVGIKADESAFLVDFVAFECAGVEQIEVDALRDADFFLELTVPEWRTYLSDRRGGRAPTLVSLDVGTPNGIVKGADPLKKLKFERFHLTLQAFLDKGADLAA